MNEVLVVFGDGGRERGPFFRRRVGLGHRMRHSSRIDLVTRRRSVISRKSGYAPSGKVDRRCAFINSANRIYSSGRK